STNKLLNLNINQMLEEKNDNLQAADGFTPENETDNIVEQINSTNAEDSELSTINESEHIPLLNYDELSLDALNTELEKLVKNEKVTAIREHVEQIKKSFLTKYNELIEEKRAQFLNENPDAFAT